MMIVTGGAGFIGSNLIAELNRKGVEKIIVVDNLKNGIKFRNLVDFQIADYIDKEDFIAAIRKGTFSLDRIKAIFHSGACSATTEWDGRYMMNNNYVYSRTLLESALKYKIPFIYASSAAVYGDSAVFQESPDHETPLNIYGYSKLLMDQVVRRHLPGTQSQVVGLRYFNVYGPRESHKGSMASTAFHFSRQNGESENICLFQGSGGYPDGEQRRDFVYVSDAVAVNLWFLDHPEVSGIFNVGTGRCQAFNNIADAVIAHHGFGKKTYIPFPDHLVGKYQSYTRADLTRLRAAGCDVGFKTVEQAVPEYIQWLDSQ